MEAEQTRSTDNSLIQKCDALLARLSAHVDGKPVVYATRYVRSDEKRQIRRVPGIGGVASMAIGTAAAAAFDIGMKAASKALGSGLPKEGWIIVTHDGLSVFSLSRFTGKVGDPKGLVPNELIQSASVERNRRTGMCNLEIGLIDGSHAHLQTKTLETYPAIDNWLKGIEPPAPAPEDVPVFDANDLFDEMPGH